MPRTETVLQVFLASPSDVAQEREIVEAVISELNRTWRNSLGISLELLRWETHVHPAAGSYPQEVINGQIGDRYDIFIGILWGRLGQPTPAAASGTIEEFNLARRRHSANPKSIEIMIYFKDAPLAPSEIDPTQLGQVKDFKNSLSSSGVFYNTFKNSSDFESTIRAHLSAVAQRWKEKDQDGLKNGLAINRAATEVVDNAHADFADEPGFLDYLDRYTVRMEEMNGATQAIAEATESVGKSINKRVAELNAIDAASDPTFLLRRKFVRATSEDMLHYAQSLGLQLPILSSARKEAFDSLSKALVLSKDFSGNGTDLEDLRNSLASMLESGSSALESLMGFRTTVGGLPRLTSDVNRAKREMGRRLEQVCHEIDASLVVAKTILETVDLMRNLELR